LEQKAFNDFEREMDLPSTKVSNQDKEEDLFQLF
jgi:hypothetical protein